MSAYLKLHISALAFKSFLSRCVKAKDFNETKLGKLWIKHSRGWSMATRKGEVFMKQITKPYALVDIERQLAEKKEAAKLKVVHPVFPDLEVSLLYLSRRKN
eukprot:1336047-Amorphochlora_amoeboformis.AAC.3